MKTLPLLALCFATTPSTSTRFQASKAASPKYSGADYPRERYQHLAASKCNAVPPQLGSEDKLPSPGSGDESKGTRKKWATRTSRNGDLDDNLERFESIKSAITGAFAGSIAAAPIALLSPNRLTAQWEFDHDALALSLALSALVYRYAVREDPNPMLKQGVVAAFAITRILALLQVLHRAGGYGGISIAQ